MNRGNNIDNYLLLVVLLVVFVAIIFLLPVESRSEIFLAASAASLLWGVARRGSDRVRTLIVGVFLFVGAAYVFQRPEPLVDLVDFAAMRESLGIDLTRWQNSLLAAPFLLLGMFSIVRVLHDSPAPAPQRPRRGLARAAASIRRGLAALPWQAALELFLIALVAWKASESLHDFSRQVQLSGVDMAPLTRAADFAGQFLRSSGKIPLWDPFIGSGEPMLEAVQSFVLNPFMSLPIMLLGAKPGVLVVTLLHAVLFGWGGWVWARVMGFGAAGRLLMGTLLVSSGSFTGPLSHGVFQLAVSQAYVPYVYAGLIAMLFLRRQRWALVMFVTATALLGFSGSFWYLLPTAFGCALIALFALVRFKDGSPRLVSSRLSALTLAGLLVLGVMAIRLMTINRELLLHPTLNYDFQLDYLQVLVNYFDPNYTTDKGRWFAVYHYVVPSLLALVVPLALVTARWIRPGITGGGRVVLAGCLIVLVMSIFGTGPTPFVMSLYETFPLLKDWRNPGRMAAAASLWIVLAVCWGFDRLALLAWRGFRREPPRHIGGAVAVAALAAAGTFGVINVARNWPESVVLLSTRDLYRAQAEGARGLRQRYPVQMLAIHTGWIEHFTLNETLIRHPYGDNEVFTIGLPPTIGVEQQEYREEFAFGDAPDSGNGIWLRENGYVEMASVPVDDYLGALLDYNPTALPYAYTVPEQTLLDQGSEPLTRADTTDATYYHRIDQVEVEVANAAPGSVVVAQETAYPGWTVAVNGLAQPIESVHRRIAVRLPPDVSSATVIFTYRPDTLYLGSLITVFSIAFLIGYALRAERLLRRGRQANVVSAPETVPVAAKSAPVVPAPAPIPAAEPLLARPVTRTIITPAPERGLARSHRPSIRIVGTVVSVAGLAVLSVFALRSRGGRRDKR